MPSGQIVKTKDTIEKEAEPESWTLFQGDTALGKVTLLRCRELTNF